MVYKALLWTDIFWISYIKWYKFYNHNLSVVLGSKQREGRALKLVNPKHEDWVSIQLVTLSVLTFLFILPRCQVIFQWKQTKEKLGNAWRAWRNFRVDLPWQMGNMRNCNAEQRGDSLWIPVKTNGYINIQ